MPAAERQDWHHLSAEEALRALGSSAEGLAAGEAARRLAEHGPNSLTIEPPTPWWRVLIRQTRSLVVALLAVAALIAAAIGDLLEAAAIGVVLLLNLGIGFWMEWRARQAMEALRRLQVASAVVIRDGRERRIDARELVPGDVIVVEPGDAVAADARLLSSAELRAVEAPLTGESAPVAKRPEPLPADTSLPDRVCLLFKGTLIAAGHGKAVVVATGADTEIGKVSELVTGTEQSKTPLERRLDALGRRLVWLTLGVAAVVAAIGLARGEDPWQMLETAIALAIAAVPEGLPVVVTVTLALGMRRMARRNALVRRLPAVETLGGATVVCTDKTGTLTEGEMTVRVVSLPAARVEVTGVGYETEGDLQVDGRRVEPGEIPGLEAALAIGLLANRARLETVDGDVKAAGDPTEGALVTLAAKGGMERDDLSARMPEVAEVPFSSQRMWMATFHRVEDVGMRALVKGAPGRVVERCSKQLGEAGPVPLDAAGRERLLEENRRLAAEGLRVLALARRDLPAGTEPGEGAVCDLTFVALVGMMDPPAPGVLDTVSKLRSAGVRTIMITGDQAVTAEAVARELGVLAPGEELMHGRELDELSAEELAGRVAKTAVFSRVSPEGKLRIVQALQERGEVVGMLGDGVNDAPALKRADIGVAMGGRGTDVAKETADLVLQDDRFETISIAVEEGRALFDNLRKFLFFLFSCNLSEVLVLFGAALAGLPLPLLPLQILWLNLITDVLPALSLAVEPPEPGVMRRPPRDPAKAILSRSFLLLVGRYGLLLTASSLGAFVWALSRHGGDLEAARTVAFMTLALTQLGHMVNARSFGPLIGSPRLWANPWAWAAGVGTAALQLAVPYLPVLSTVLGVRPPSSEDWAVIAFASVAPVVLGQGWKWLAARRRPL